MSAFGEEADRILSSLPADMPEWGRSLVGLVKCMLGELTSVKEILMLKSQVAVQAKIIDNLVAENDRINKQVIDIADSVDSNEQHNRNIYLILRGVPEEDEDEETTSTFVDILNKHLPTKLVPADISRSHRLGKKSNKARPIIARFARETKKMEIFRMKKHLKGKGVSLAENLTKKRVDLVKQASIALDTKMYGAGRSSVFKVQWCEDSHQAFF